MVGKDPIKSKYYEGTLAGGQFGSKWTDPQFNFKGEPEPKGPFGGEMKHIKKVEGRNRDKSDGKEESSFSLQSKSYAGPENWQTTNLGVRNPDDLEHN